MPKAEAESRHSQQPAEPPTELSRVHEKADLAVRTIVVPRRARAVTTKKNIQFSADCEFTRADCAISRFHPALVLR